MGSRLFIVSAVALLLATALFVASATAERSHEHVRGTPTIQHLRGIHKIQHVVIIMQENRSFDSYFGTYPGADGIPGLAGNPGSLPCVPDPKLEVCQEPYHDTANRNYGGPHTHLDALKDIAGGEMDGFIDRVRAATDCTTPNAPNCANTETSPDVMG